MYSACIERNFSTHNNQHNGENQERNLIIYMYIVDVNPIKLLGYSHDIVVKSQIYAMKFAS